MAGEYENLDTSGESTVKKPCGYRFITGLSRLFGAVVGLVCGYASYKMLSHNRKTVNNGDKPSYEENFIAHYSIFAALSSGILEQLWILPWLTCCFCEPEGCFCRFWKAVDRVIDAWRKTILYTALSIMLFIPGYTNTWAQVMGVSLMALGLMYFLRTFEECNNYKRSNSKAP